MKRATEGMSGREIFRYYDRTVRDNEYGRIISSAKRTLGDEKAYAMLEEAERNGNRLYASMHPDDVKEGFSHPRTIIKVVSIEEYNSLMSD